jgi:hypothetical protein
MMRSSLGLAVACCLAGCSGIPLLVPDTRTTADRARQIEPRCKDFAEERVQPMLAPMAIDSVEPAYSYVQSGPNDREARLRGARIHVKPLPGFSREALARGIECHQARVTLGQVAAGTDDPYVLAGQWLDVDVDSEGDGFAILVRAEQADVARQVLQRAQRFVNQKQ